MPRRHRIDRPGTWHHVINRGIARRPLFLGALDVRYFLSRLAREVRGGSLEVHAWCVLTTHFHLMVRSLQGELSAALRRTQNGYCRRFNRLHGRDGPLLRGRFYSKVVGTEAYRRTLLAYIDDNPVQAGLADDPLEYPWCSAAAHALGVRPPWLQGRWVDSTLGSRRKAGEDRIQAYRRVFARRDYEDRERMLLAPGSTSQDREDVDSLLSAASPRVLAWLQNKTKLADGRRTETPVCTRGSVLEVLAQGEARTPSWAPQVQGRKRPGWSIMKVGLLRTLAGCTADEVQAVTRSGRHSQLTQLKLHRHALDEDPTYGALASELTSQALRRSYC